MAQIQMRTPGPLPGATAPPTVVCARLTSNPSCVSVQPSTQFASVGVRRLETLGRLRQRDLSRNAEGDVASDETPSR
jgi:hypothetical protein